MLLRNQWNHMLNLTAMVFERPASGNSESRAMAIAFKLIKTLSHILNGVVSFSDGNTMRDGTIYRAAGFVLTDIREMIKAACKSKKTGRSMHVIQAHPLTETGV